MNQIRKKKLITFYHYVRDKQNKRVSFLQFVCLVNLLACSILYYSNAHWIYLALLILVPICLYIDIKLRNEVIDRLEDLIDNEMNHKPY